MDGQTHVYMHNIYMYMQFQLHSHERQYIIGTIRKKVNELIINFSSSFSYPETHGSLANIKMLNRTIIWLFARESLLHMIFIPNQSKAIQLTLISFSNEKRAAHV